jgi:hypothetical protein
MRLDNRSRSIIITGEALQQSEAQQPIKEWYEENGGNMSINDNGVVFTFPNREMAEKVSFQKWNSRTMLMIRYLLLEQLLSRVRRASLELLGTLRRRRKILMSKCRKIREEVIERRKSRSKKQQAAAVVIDIPFGRVRRPI